jgi:acyl-CoA synthetase (AMP-forming)/AMP-acid ligase II
MSPDGYITITGRIKDLIIRGGENIHPLEIENCLLTCPGVADVSVVGVPDERYGEVVAAFVIPQEQNSEATQEDTIREWVRHGLSHHLGKNCRCVFHVQPLTRSSPEVCVLLPAA